LVGSIVIWLSKEKAHIATLAVRPGYRQRGIAQKLLSRGLLACSRLGVNQAMLEVRASNQAAQQLYSKFGFDVVGLRPGYYKDTREDGVQMKLAPLQPEKLIDLAG
jgi:[ribosomal protein S18]-alanine N-acetyltransferase